MKHAKILLFATALTLAGQLVADEKSFPEILDAGIPGTPKLGQPILVTGATKPILTEKHGLAAPALWDWDGDGKRDLLVGEFETNSSDFPMGADGSTIRVYLNVGTDADPKFTDEFEWARDTEGTIMEVPQWCCIGFTPQFVDLDDDGHVDMITGQYHPGEVTWFQGTGDGFLPGETLPQEGDPNSNGQPAFGNYEGEPGDIGTFHYWVYTSASFGDFDDDGDYDLIVGGGDGLRISENIGSPRRPSFAMREPLLTIDGKPLKILDRGPEWLAMLSEHGEIPSPDGDGKSSPLVVDWDDDGVLDLLVTGSYRHPASQAVSFFRGVKTDDGHRFHPAVDLLPTADGAKALPGSGQRVYVDDWNSDGVSDLIIGASVATVNGGEFSDELSWEWEDVNEVESAGKDPGLYPPRERPTADSEFMAWARDNYTEEEFEEHLKMNQDYWYQTVGRLYDEGKADWLTMRHQGRIYVMLGEQREASPVTADAVPVPADTPKRRSASTASAKPPVTLAFVSPDEVLTAERANLSVNFTMRPGWYIYAPTGRNAPHGMIETSVSFGLPEGIETAGPRSLPLHHFKGLYDIYEGADREWAQPVEASAAGSYEVTAKVTYQTCKDDLCLPPRTETLRTVLAVADAGG
ncbi:MAG: FG-GAP-like repeat-containing protein [Gammaproteobacteria bacterium]|nr:FG-GAP-like repeat-containing protein [Gammaproteobacteria bacterium]